MCTFWIFLLVRRTDYGLASLCIKRFGTIGLREVIEMCSGIYGGTTAQDDLQMVGVT